MEEKVLKIIDIHIEDLEIKRNEANRKLVYDSCHSYYNEIESLARKSAESNRMIELLTVIKEEITREGE